MERCGGKNADYQESRNVKTTPELRAKMRQEAEATFFRDDVPKLGGVLALLDDVDELLAPNDEDIVMLADWIKRLLTPETGKTLDERTREVVMDMIRAKQALVAAKADTRDKPLRCRATGRHG